MKENIKVKGSFVLTLRDKDGNFKEERKEDNLIVNASLSEITGLLGNVGTKTAFTYLAVGTGTTAANVADTTLEAEIVDSGLARASATVSQQTTTVTEDTLRLQNGFTVTGTKAVTEIGALNAASAGTLLGHQVFTALNVIATDVLTFQYNFVFAGA